MRRHRRPAERRPSAEQHRPPTDVSLRGLLTMAAVVVAVPLVLVALSHPVVVASLTVGLGGLLAVLARD